MSVPIPHIWIPPPEKVILPGEEQKPLFPGKRHAPAKEKQETSTYINYVSSAQGLDIPTPTLFYRLNEASGNAIENAVGGGTHDLTDTNTVTQTTGPNASGNARQFTAANTEYFTKADNAVFQLNTDATISMWIYLDSKATFRAFVYKANATDVTGSEYHVLYHQTNNKLQCTITDSSDNQYTTQTVAGTLNPSTGIWYCYQVQWNGSVIKNRVDGNAWDAGASATAYPRTTAGPFRIGARSDASLPMDGRIAMVAIWKGTLLTNTEADNFYNAGSGAYWDGSIWVAHS